MHDTLPVPFAGRGRLAAVVDELRRQVDARVDFVADSRDFRVAVLSPTDVRLIPGPSARDFLPADGVPMLDQALTQLADRLDPPMPVRYLRALIERAPVRFADLATGLLHDNGKRRLFRVLDGRVRAILGDTFRPIESLDVVVALLRGAQENPAVRVLEASLTASHLRVKLCNPTVFAAIDSAAPGTHEWIAPGDAASAEWRQRVGLTIEPPEDPQGGPSTLWPLVTASNSETGQGRMVGHVGTITRACCNLAIHEETLAHVHLGERLDSGMFRQDTVSAEAKAIALKARDLVAVAFDETRFRALVDTVRAATEQPVAAPVTAARNVLKLTDSIADSELDALVATFSTQPGRPTVYALGQAVARMAQDTQNADVAFERERLAGAIMRGEHSNAILQPA